MKVLNTIQQLRTERAALGLVAFVPTLGALHDAHVSLMRIAREHAPHVVVSIFVNPTQFGPREDYNKYPRTLDDDLARCEAAGVELVFAPTAEEMYPQAEATKRRSDEATKGAGGDMAIDIPSLTSVLEGKHRPGHFKGVCQVVAKLFNIVQPQFACFGQKDYQQLRVITAMVEALNWPVQIVPCPTVRDPDGMAMSSRNRYLSPEDRQRGLAISRGLFLAQGEVKSGERRANRLVASIQNLLLEQHLAVDYVAAVDPLTLKPVDVLEGPTVLVVAARVGATRLIDNLTVAP